MCRVLGVRLEDGSSDNAPAWPSANSDTSSASVMLLAVVVGVLGLVGSSSCEFTGVKKDLNNDMAWPLDVDGP